MPAIEIKPGIHWIGVNDRTTDLFEGLWPITKEGVSYNSYLVKDKKSALIDLAKDFKADELLGQIAQLVEPEKLDYIVINHMEPDHTGVLRTLRRVAPQVQILTSQKAVPMLETYYQITDGVHVVEDGETLELGEHALHFVSTPFVHWPETIMTYETSQRVLFSCDAFGGYGALQGAIFDDQCRNLAFYEREALRYYVNIVALYHRAVLKAIDKLADVPVDVVAPSHGLIWREHPERIIQLYKAWAEYATAPGDLGVTLLYGTMYGRTEEMVEAVAEGVVAAGVPLEIFDVRHIHASYYLPAVYRNRGVLIGAPTYEGGIFPPMYDALHALLHKRIFNRQAAYFGSCGWSGGARRDFAKMAEELRWEVPEDGLWEFKGGATPDLLRQGFEFGRAFGASLQEEYE